MKSLLSERPKCLSVMSNELGISCQIHDGAKYAIVSRAFKGQRHDSDVRNAAFFALILKAISCKHE